MATGDSTFKFHGRRLDVALQGERACAVETSNVSNAKGLQGSCLLPHEVKVRQRNACIAQMAHNLQLTQIPASLRGLVG
jgi:hypothetical protein